MTSQCFEGAYRLHQLVRGCIYQALMAETALAVHVFLRYLQSASEFPDAMGRDLPSSALTRAWKGGCPGR